MYSIINNQLNEIVANVEETYGTYNKEEEMSNIYLLILRFYK